jgi:hypothetical protein
MKIAIPNGFLIEPDAPVLTAEAVKIKGRERWRVWCAHCNVHHLHGVGEGHREAHCNDTASPYWKRGYNLAKRD